MSGSARSRVDLHLASCQELIKLAAAHGDHTAVASSLCLQFEMALGFYLIELVQSGKSKVQPWPVSQESLAELARQREIPDLQELAVLSQDEDSWLHRMLRRLALLREYDAARPIKAAIFQSDLEEPSKVDNLIISSRQAMKPAMDTKTIAVDLQALTSLVSRQRLGHEEY